MKDVYEDQSKDAQSLIRYLVKVDARPNTNMAIFKTYVLKRQASALGTSVPQPAPPPATSSVSSPSPAGVRTGVQQTATVKALLAHGKHLSLSQLARKLVSPVKHRIHYCSPLYLLQQHNLWPKGSFSLQALLFSLLKMMMRSWYLLLHNVKHS
ncbi:hypothetical protein QQF64_034590 [Cirrhinus molitorella]|uniref:Uncharacterized protein n=1 Tax=Cirrhinus molitorella TaxID=172907 RepID=A0ABR3L0W1_9TELE